MAAKRPNKSLLSRQDIAVRRKQLSQKRAQKTSGGGRRAIAGVLLLAFSILALFSIATFDAKDRLGPGFHNAIGPVGHALAEALRGLLGVCAFVVPFVGLYGAGVFFLGDREKRRWSQVVAFVLLLISGAVLAQLVFTEDTSWAHAPGGLIGRSVGGVLTALFSTLGTVVLVSAIACVAFIVGTQLAFLSFCSWVWAQATRLADRTKTWAIAFAAAQRERMEARRELRAKAEEEEAEFLAMLEAEEEELNELEAAAADAEAAAAEVERREMTVEEARAAELVERERLKQEKERHAIEREAARLAKDALKAVRTRNKDARQASVTAVAASLSTAVSAPATMMTSPGQDPAWVTSWAIPASAQAMSMPPSAASVPPARRVPTIVQAPAAPSPVEAISADVAVGPQLAANSVPPPAGATALATVGPSALARLPLIVEPKAPPKPTKKNQEQFQFADGRTSFSTPSVELLEMQKRERTTLDKDAYLSTAEKLTAKLRDFSIDGEVVEIRPGPVVTMYEFKPAPGVKVSKIAALADDLAMAMEAMRVRIVAPIPGKGVVGIEVPNRERETVFLKEIAEQDAFTKSPSKLAMCLGKDIEGMPYILDLAKAPHLLMAGTTGSGKSVSVNAMIMSILLKSTPEEVRFIMVDPKMLELSVYEGIPHLLLPVVTDPRKAAIALQWAVEEMTRRYKLLSEAGVRNITGYNTLIDAELVKKKEVAAAPVAPVAAEPAKKPRKLLIVDVADGDPQGEDEPMTDPMASMGVAAPSSADEDPREEVLAELRELGNEGEIRVEEPTAEESAALAQAAALQASEEAASDRKKLPYIVVIIDELADLMMVASKEVETSIARLAQMARAAGIHLMVATQRPSTDVVTGIIKANFPTRISFMLRSKPDSMTILGTVGAEALLGMGDMLIMPPTSAHLQRVHGCFVSEQEIKKVVDHLKAQGKPVYDEEILKPRDEDGGEGGDGQDDELSDELWDQALAVVGEMRSVSISMLQRKMRIGYNRAARMIERMERDGLVGPADGAKPREVLMKGQGAAGLM